MHHRHNGHRKDHATANRSDGRGAREEAKELTSSTAPRSKDDTRNRAGEKKRQIPANCHGKIYSRLKAILRPIYTARLRSSIPHPHEAKKTPGGEGIEELSGGKSWNRRRSPFCPISTVAKKIKANWAVGLCPARSIYIVNRRSLRSITHESCENILMLEHHVHCTNATHSIIS